MQRLAIFTGPMWSGKTTKLIHHVLQYKHNFERVFPIKHSIDTRTSAQVIRARSGEALHDAHPCNQLHGLGVEEDVLYAIDEAQFFDVDDLLLFCQRVVETTAQSHLAIAGLDLDFAKHEFGGILPTIEWATENEIPATVMRLTAFCNACGRPAPYTQRLSTGGEQTVVIGDADVYQPACEIHHNSHPITLEAWNQLKVDNTATTIVDPLPKMAVVE